MVRGRVRVRVRVRANSNQRARTARRDATVLPRSLTSCRKLLVAGVARM